MANIIQIKRGENAPTIDVLEDYELGYCTDEQALYIRDDENVIRLSGLPITGGTLTGDLNLRRYKSDDVGNGAILNFLWQDIGYTQNLRLRHEIMDSYRLGFGLILEASTGNDPCYFETSGEIYADIDKRVYHTGYKPSAADVGALSTSGGTLSGSLTINGGLTVNGAVNSKYLGSNTNLNNIVAEGTYYCNLNAIAMTMTNVPSALAFSLRVTKHAGVHQEFITYSNTSSFRIYRRNYYDGTWSSWYEDFTENHPPTASEIGLGNVNNWGASTSVSSTSTTTYATSSAVKSAYDRGTSGINAAATKLPLSGGTITGNLTINGDINTSSKNVLHKRVRLSASDGTSIDNVQNEFGFDYNTGGAGLAGPYISFSGLGNNYQCQITADYGDGRIIKYRTHNGDNSGSWNSWYRFYTTGYKNISMSQTFSGSASSASATGTFIIFTATPSSSSDPVSCCLSLKNTTVQIADNNSWSSFTWNGTTLSRNGGNGLIKNVQSFTIQ